MKLWIRSQDKLGLIICNGIGIYEKNKMYELAYGFTTYGRYKTKERALEVLDEIQSKIAENKCLELMLPKVTDVRGYEEQYGRMFKETIYQMPKE